MSEKKYQYLISFVTEGRTGNSFISSQNKNFTAKNIDEIKEGLKKRNPELVGNIIINNIINLGYMTYEEFYGESNGQINNKTNDKIFQKLFHFVIRK